MGFAVTDGKDSFTALVSDPFAKSLIGCAAAALLLAVLGYEMSHALGVAFAVWWGGMRDD